MGDIHPLVPCFPWGQISTSGTISLGRNYVKCKYMYICSFKTVQHIKDENFFQLQSNLLVTWFIIMILWVSARKSVSTNPSTWYYAWYDNGKNVGCISNCELTKNTLYFALTGKLWSVFVCTLARNYLVIKGFEFSSLPQNFPGYMGCVIELCCVEGYEN